MNFGGVASFMLAAISSIVATFSPPGAMLALDGFGAGPRMVGGTLAIGLPLDAVEFWPARISAVTRGQVEAAARAVLPSAPNSAAWLLPAA